MTKHTHVADVMKQKPFLSTVDKNALTLHSWHKWSYALDRSLYCTYSYENVVSIIVTWVLSTIYVCIAYKPDCI